MKTISIYNINLTENQYDALAELVISNVRNAWEEDQRGNHANGVFSDLGKVSCQILYNIYKDRGLTLSHETISAINFVNTCTPVSAEDCKSFINSYLEECWVTIFDMRLTKKTAEAILENLINDYNNMVDITVETKKYLISPSLCLLIKTFLDAGVGKVVPSCELLIRILAKDGDVDEAKVILTLSLPN